MLNKVSRIVTVFLFIGFLSFSALDVFAAGGFTSTYNMKGGLYTRSFTTGSKEKITIDLTPTTGVSNVDILLYPEVQIDGKWRTITDLPEMSVSSTSKSSSSYNAKGYTNHRIYLRHYANQVFTGNIKVTWN